MTDTLHASTTLHAAQETVYDLIRDVEGFEAYSDYVEDATRHGSGGVGTEYGVTLGWWRLSYTARFRVVDLEPPERIEWRLTKDLAASLVWRLEPVDVDDPDVEDATHVVAWGRYDPGSADESALSLPPLVSMSSVVERARPVVEREADRVLARVIEDLEGEPRRASLDIDTNPDAG